MAILPYQKILPSINKSAYIASSADIIGKVSIEAHASIWPMSVVRGDVNTITIGENTNIQDGSVLHVTHDGPHSPGGLPLIIGCGVTVGHKALLHACTINDDVLIGMGAIVMDGVTIESNVIVGAGSLVPPGKTCESGYLWLGNPAKPVRKLTDKEIEHIRYSAQYYKQLKNNYLND